MPRRNLIVLLLMTVVSVICCQAAQSNRYGRMLAHTLDVVSRRYYEPVRDADLFAGAMKGMLARLDDNSAYFPPGQQRQEFDEIVSKEFCGVGFSLDPNRKPLTILSPILGSPAFEKGIRAGDRILKIEGRSTQGMSQDDAVALIRGKPGTSLTLSILHPEQSTPVEIKLVRRIVQLDTVSGDTRNADGSWNFMLPGPDDIGYIRLDGFAESERGTAGEKTTVADLRHALEGLRTRGMRGLVLDLRGNPGGSLEAAIQTCDLFLHEGVIVTTRGRDGRILKTETASGKGPFTDFPMAVLVNQYSASASEIVAACLQDHHRAVVVGQRSYGKGTVQELLDLGDQCGELKLTIATYWRPSGRNIHRTAANKKDGTWGVMPDEGYQVTVGDEELEHWQQWRQERDNVPAAAEKTFVDRPLLKALEYLRKAAG